MALILNVVSPRATTSTRHCSCCSCYNATKLLLGACGGARRPDAETPDGRDATAATTSTTATTPPSPAIRPPCPQHSSKARFTYAGRPHAPTEAGLQADGTRTTNMQCARAAVRELGRAQSPAAPAVGRQPCLLRKEARRSQQRTRRVRMKTDLRKRARTTTKMRATEAMMTAMTVMKAAPEKRRRECSGVTTSAWPLDGVHATR